MQLPTYPPNAREDVRPLLPPSARRVLDIGCGPGGFGRTLRETYPGAHLAGVEAETSQAAAARAEYDVVHDGFFPDALPASEEPYDVVTLNDVVEHVVDPWELLRAVAGRLAPGGAVVAAIPNVQHFTVAGPLLLRGAWTYDDAGILDRTHVRFFTRETVLELFATAGYQVERVVGLNAPWDGNPRLRPLRAVLPHRLDGLLHLHHGVVARLAD